MRPDLLPQPPASAPPPGTALKPGTVLVTAIDPSDVMVTVDGDSAASHTQSLVGALVTGARVMVMFWPPSGAYIIGVIKDGPWIDAQFNSGWVNYGSTSQTVQYRRDGSWVSVRGVAKRTSGASAVILSLPDGFQPSEAENFAVDSDPQEHANVTVLPNGSVEWFPSTLATPAYVSLSGIRFAAAT